MKLSSKAELAILCAPGVCLQIGGAWWALRAGWEEVNLFVGVLLAAVGTAWSMFGLERYAAQLGRRDAWALAALLGPAGPLLVARLRPGRLAPRRRRRPAPSGVDRWIGVALTGLIGGGFVWAGVTWLAGPEWPPPPSADEMRRNEQLAYERLQRIALAQARYRDRDWDGDGRKTYAAFHIHLWQSVDATGAPVPVELIDRQLGVAMAREFALDGYVYESVHLRALPPGDKRDFSPGVPPGAAEIDPAEQWAVVAVPAFPRRTGMIALLADGAGGIWLSRAVGTGRMVLPDDPAARGWTKVESAAQLTEQQQSIPYADALAKLRR